jgi:hypothetical protein
MADDCGYRSMRVSPAGHVPGANNRIDAAGVPQAHFLCPWVVEWLAGD